MKKEELKNLWAEFVVLREQNRKEIEKLKGKELILLKKIRKIEKEFAYKHGKFKIGNIVSFKEFNYLDKDKIEIALISNMKMSGDEIVYKLNKIKKDGTMSSISANRAWIDEQDLKLYVKTCYTKLQG